MDKYKHSMVHKCLLSRGHINSHHLIFSSLSPFLISFIPNPPFLWLPSLRLLVPQHSSPQFFMFSPPSRTIFASIQRAHISWHLRVSFTHSIHLALIHSFSPFSFINPFKSSFSSSLHRLCALQHMWALRSKSFLPNRSWDFSEGQQKWHQGYRSNTFWICFVCVCECARRKGYVLPLRIWKVYLQ